MEQGVFNWKPYLVVVAILLGFGMTVLAMARSMGLVYTLKFSGHDGPLCSLNRCFVNFPNSMNVVAYPDFGDKCTI
jgi:hypothetical protein